MEIESRGWGRMLCEVYRIDPKQPLSEALPRCLPDLIPMTQGHFHYLAECLRARPLSLLAVSINPQLAP
jgi:hypothetical protein